MFTMRVVGAGIGGVAVQVAERYWRKTRAKEWHYLVVPLIEFVAAGVVSRVIPRGASVMQGVIGAATYQASAGQELAAGIAKVNAGAPTGQLPAGAEAKGPGGLVERAFRRVAVGG
jgi:hypothetical protein